MLNDLIRLLASFVAVAVVLTLHEFAHAAVAYLCGDPTAKWNKRLSLNPLRHFDLTGLICFTVAGFGWGKPVPVNAGNFRKPRLGMALTSLAGVTMNYFAALLLYPFFLIVSLYMPYTPFLTMFLHELTWMFYAYNLSFFVFNLLPLPPLDGFHVLEAADRKKGPVFRFLERYGNIILLALIAESFLCNAFVRFGVYEMHYFNILGWLTTFATDYLGWPIMALWGTLI